MQSLRPFIVAIDAGTCTGVAIWQRKGEKVSWFTKDFVSCIEFIENSFGLIKDQVKIFVEVPEKMLYGRNVSEIRKQELTIMYHAGGNRREALLLAKMLRHRGFVVEEVPPIREKKWDSRRMEMMTGSKARSNEHERDAARLAIVYANKR